MRIQIIMNDSGSPAGKLADAEIHFTDGPLAGLKLIGFGVWARRTGGDYNVTFPARQYSINGERRSFALLRPAGDDAHATMRQYDAQANIRQMIIDAYREQVDQQ